MGRKEITAGLSELLERHLAKSGDLWAREVSIENLGRCRPDYMSVSAPFGAFASLSGIERATVTAYEVKSCMADYRSGNGLNGIGDRNYVVAPYELAMRAQDEHIGPGGEWGVAYPYPESHGRMPRCDEIPRYGGQVDGWRLFWVDPALDPQHLGRRAPLTVMLWSMMHAGVRKGPRC